MRNKIGEHSRVLGRRGCFNLVLGKMSLQRRLWSSPDAYAGDLRMRKSAPCRGSARCKAWRGHLLGSLEQQKEGRAGIQ